MIFSMKVIVQRLAEGVASAGAPAFVNQVFDVKLRALQSDSHWYVLEDVALSSAPVLGDERLPILHKGYFDSHLHVTWMGLKQNEIDLQGVRSVEELEERVRNFISNAPASMPVWRGHGWDEGVLGVSLDALTRYLESRLPDSKPLVLYRICGHSAFVNRNVRVRGGRQDLACFVTDRDLIGLAELLPQADEQECAAAFLRAQSQLVKVGISAVGDMSLDETSAAGIRGLAARGELLIDVQGVIDGGRAPSVENNGPLTAANAAAIGPLDRAAVFSVRHWKKYLDGSLGSSTAWLSRAYSDSDGFGDSLQKISQLCEGAREALIAGFHLSFHAIGDAALDQALEIGDLLHRQLLSRKVSDPSLDWPATYHRLEHVQVARDDQIRRMQEQKLWAICTQPGHRVSDQHFVGARLGNTRLQNEGYRAASFMRAGIPVALSSDAPIATHDPDSVIRFACTHPNPKERLTLTEAVWRYTTGSRLDLGLSPGNLKKGATVFMTVPENIV